MVILAVFVPSEVELKVKTLLLSADKLVEPEVETLICVPVVAGVAELAPASTPASIKMLTLLAGLVPVAGAAVNVLVVAIEAAALGETATLDPKISIVELFCPVSLLAVTVTPSMLTPLVSAPTNPNEAAEGIVKPLTSVWVAFAVNAPLPSTTSLAFPT